MEQLGCPGQENGDFERIEKESMKTGHVTNKLKKETA